MNSIRFTIMSLLSFLIIVLLQINIFNNITIFAVVANLYIIYCIYNCILSDNNNLSIGIAIFTGFVYDICLGNFVGISALIGFLITILTPVFCNKVAIDTRLGVMIYTFIVTFLSQVFYGIMYIILSNAIFILDRFVIIVLVSSVYNFIVIAFVHSIFSKYLKERDEMYKIVRRY